MSKRNLGIGEMIKLGLTLVCYAVASCAVLAVVNNITAPQIQKNQMGAAAKAMSEVFVEADDFVTVSNAPSSSNSTITVSDFYLAKKGGSVIGAVVQVAGPTYDKGKLIVGIDKSGTVSGMRILELSDSPGFGLKANDPTFKLPSGVTFYDQFAGKDAKNGFKINENFDAITGATITSNAIGDLMTEGTSCLLKVLEGINE